MGSNHEPDAAKRPRTPVWTAIATALRADVAEGRYGPGDKLPTEAALAARFGVNRHTVRRAVASLIKENLLRSRRGAGTFVTQRPTDYPLGTRVRFHESLLAGGHQPEKTFHMIETRQATDAEAQALQIAVGAPICVCHGLSRSDGQAIAVFESHFPLMRLPGIDRALSETTSVTTAFERCGVTDYVRASTRLTATRADATQALHLELAEGDPLLRSIAINADTAGAPIEYSQTYFAGERVTLTLEGP